MANYSIGADLHEAFGVQNFTTTEQFSSLNLTEEELKDLDKCYNRHNDEEFEKKFNEMFDKKVRNDLVGIVVDELKRAKRISVWDTIKYPFKRVGSLLCGLFGKKTEGEKKSTDDVKLMVDETSRPELKPAQSDEPDERTKELIKSGKYTLVATSNALDYNELRDNSDKETQKSYTKSFNEWNKERDDLVAKVYIKELEKRGLKLVPADENAPRLVIEETDKKPNGTDCKCDNQDTCIKHEELPVKSAQTIC